MSTSTWSTPPISPNLLKTCKRNGQIWKKFSRQERQRQLVSLTSSSLISRPFSRPRKSSLQSTKSNTTHTCNTATFWNSIARTALQQLLMDLWLLSQKLPLDHWTRRIRIWRGSMASHLEKLRWGGPLIRELSPWQRVLTRIDWEATRRSRASRWRQRRLKISRRGARRRTSEDSGGTILLLMTSLKLSCFDF